MSIRIRSPKDFYAGVMFLSFGVLATWVAGDYPMGSAIRMGPGYFPRVLGALLCLLGVAICARGLAVTAERIEPVRLRPVILILGAVGLFAAGIESGGIVLLTVVAVVVAAAATEESRPLEVAILLAFLLAMSVGVFTYALGLPFKLQPVLPFATGG
jgi:hypothetical protein